MAKAFHNMTERELAGRKVRLLKQITTKGGAIFGAGLVMTIKRKWAGLELEQTTICEACGCGSRRSVNKVDFSSVELLP